MSEVIESPSGWNYRSDQENGNDVDCWYCGDRLDDDFPIDNDEQQRAYHPTCLEQEQEGNR